MLDKNKIALLPLTDTNIPIMLQVAADIKAAGHVATVIVSNNLVKDRIKKYHTVIDSEVIFNNVQEDINGEISNRSIKQKVSTEFVQKIKNKTKVFLWKFIPILFDNFYIRELIIRKKVNFYNKQLDVSLKVLEKIKPMALVIPGDREMGYEPAILKACRIIGIPSIVIPIASAASVEGGLVFRRNNNNCKITNNHSLKNKYPQQWVHDIVSNNDFLFYSKLNTIALDRVGMLPKNPWGVLGGGYSDVLLVSDEVAKETAISKGVSENKIKITGHYMHDELFHAMNNSSLKKNVYKKYNFSPEKKLFIVGASNWYEAGLMSQKESMNENIFLFDLLSKLDCNVLVSLHPRQQRGDYENIVSKYKNLVVSDYPLSNIISVADLYVVQTGSSTISWAIMTHVPVLIDDHFDFKENFYRYLPGVVHKQSKEGFSVALNKFAKDESFLIKAKLEQKKISRRYGILDGGAQKRIINEILQIGNL